MKEAAMSSPRALLEAPRHALWNRADARQIDAIVADYASWRGENLWLQGGVAPELLLAARVGAFLQEFIGERLQSLRALHARAQEFSRRHALAGSDEEREAHILDMAAALGSRGRALEQDRAALARWFDADAVIERYRRRVHQDERLIVLALQRLGPMVAQLLPALRASQEPLAAWRHIQLEATVVPLLTYNGDERLRVAAFRCLTAALAGLPRELQQHALSGSSLHYLQRSAGDRDQNVWIQAEALVALEGLAPAMLARALRDRLQRPGEGDDLFLRRRALLLLGRCLPQHPELQPLLQDVLRDPSPYVRQALPAALATLAPGAAAPLLRQLACGDPVPQVRTAALLDGLALLHQPDWCEPLLALLLDVLAQEQDPLVLRSALQLAREGHALLLLAQPPRAARWDAALGPVLNLLHTAARQVPVRRWAAQAREYFWCQRQPQRAQLAQALQQRLGQLRPGRSERLPPALVQGWSADALARVLAFAVQEDFGAELERDGRRWFLHRLPRFGWRGWRVLHELRHPMPEKRQAYPHTSGRLFQGSLRAPSPLLGELSETKVPGEPLFLASEGGWRPYLPLPDEVLASLALDEPTRLYNGEGITELCPPPTRRARLRAWLLLNWRYADYARLRNWHEDDTRPARGYVTALEQLGFRLRLLPHEGEGDWSYPLDPLAERFFP